MATTLASSNASQFLVPQYLAASRQELERLHRELERKDAILLTMAQRIPELEVAREQRESPQRPSEQQGGRTAYPEDGGAEKASWWRRFFGLE